MPIHEIVYHFSFSDGRRETIPVRFDAATLELELEPPPQPPPWTELGFEQCANCPLGPDTHPHCPVALSLLAPVHHFRDVVSYQRLRVRVDTGERHIVQETSAQTAVSSLMGLIMATSGCPNTAFFKPMARFHLPFASEEETVYRAASMYLLGQYFRNRRGQPADLDLKGLQAVYAGIATVNRGMARRLRAASHSDSAVNALVLLDLFTKALPAAIDDALVELEYLYRHYL